MRRRGLGCSLRREKGILQDARAASAMCRRCLPHARRPIGPRHGDARYCRVSTASSRSRGWLPAVASGRPSRRSSRRAALQSSFRPIAAYAGRARTYGRDITRRRQERAAWADAYRASFGARRGEHGCAICHARRTVRDARGAGYMAPCHVARFPRAAGRVERVERPASEAADGSPGPPLPFGTCNGATACGAGPGPCASPEGGRVSRGRPPPQRGDEPTAARRVEGDGG